MVNEFAPPPRPRVRLISPQEAGRQAEELGEERREAMRVLIAVRGVWQLSGAAGTGVTSTLVDVAVERAQRTGGPQGVLFVAASKRAATTARRRIQDGLRSKGTEYVADTALARSVHSLAFALVRMRRTQSLRLITGAEHDVMIRDLLRGQAHDGRGEWPADIRPALTTVGFARQLRDFLLRAMERGCGPEELCSLGSQYGRPMWSASGAFLREYRQVMALSGVDSLTAPELVAAALAEVTAHPELVAGRWHTLVVDDVQHLDPISVAFVQALAPHTELCVVGGDPDQAVFGFRGASPRVLQRFAVPPEQRCTLHRKYREPQARVLKATSKEVEHAAVVDEVRRAHLLRRVPWKDIAVIVRSTSQIDAVRRDLLGAGVPVAVAETELVLAAQPLVNGLLLGLRALWEPLSDAEFEALALGPVGGADAVTLRRLFRGLRRYDFSERAIHTARSLVQPTSRGNLIDVPPELVDVLTERELDILHRLRTALGAAARARAEGQSPEEVLWALWQATGLADRLSTEALRGGAAGSQADADLDAVMALFDAAGDYGERRGAGASVEGFVSDIEAQDIPLGVRDRRRDTPDAVTVSTAHGSVGQEWRCVVVTGLQEDVWPALAETGSLFEQEEFLDVVDYQMSPQQPVARLAERVREERRLFHVATTRATQSLLLTCIENPEDEELADPSRFVQEFLRDHDAALSVPTPCSGGASEPVDAEITLPGQASASNHAEKARARGWIPVLSPESFIAELRRVVCDPEAREAECLQAARQLGRLAQGGVPGADPAEWWAATQASSDAVLRRPGDALSPSAVKNGMVCPLRAVLDGVVESDTTSKLPALRGTLLHAFAEAVARGVDVEVAQRIVTDAWEKCLDEPEWHREDARAHWAELLSKTRQWLAGAAARELVGIELPVDVTVAPGVRVRGRIDRVEKESDGRLRVVDLKSGKKAESHDKAESNAQLRTYQLALACGSVSAQGVYDGDEHPELGGAELVYPGEAARKATIRKQAPLSVETAQQWGTALARVSEDITGPQLRAASGPHCRDCSLHLICPAQPEGNTVTHA